MLDAEAPRYFQDAHFWAASADRLGATCPDPNTPCGLTLRRDANGREVRCTIPVGLRAEHTGVCPSVRANNLVHRALQRTLRDCVEAEGAQCELERIIPRMCKRVRPGQIP